MSLFLDKTVGCLILVLVLSFQPAPSAAAENEPVYKGQPVSVWVADLKDDLVLTRRAAVRALVILAPESQIAATALAGALADRNETVRLAAAEGLQKLGPKATAALPQLVNLFENMNPKIRLSAIDAIKGLGPEAKGAAVGLTVALGDRDDSVRHAAADALGQMGPESKKAVLPQLLKQIESKDPVVRVMAIETIGRLAPVPKEVVSDLAKVLARSPDFKKYLTLQTTNLYGTPIERHDAAATLLRLGPLARDAAPTLIEALSSKDPVVVWCAGLTLGRMEKEAANLLIKELKGEEASLKDSAVIYALSRMGPDAQVVVPTLRKLCKATTPEMRLLPACALAHISPDDKKEAEEILRAILRNLDRESLNIWVAFLLAELRPEDGGGAVNVFARLVRTKEEGNFLAVYNHLGGVYGLAMLGPAAKPARKELEAALLHKDPAVRVLAAYTLAQVNPTARKEAVQTLFAIWNGETQTNSIVDAIPALLLEFDGLESTHGILLLSLYDALLEKEPGDRVPTSFFLKWLRESVSVSPDKTNEPLEVRVAKVKGFARGFAREALWLIVPEEAGKMGIPKP
jgi:HEAT repeat protein